MLKLLRISSVPALQKPKVEADFQTLASPTYEAGYEQYFKNFYAVADAFVYELNQTGSCNAIEVVFNHTSLQQVWAQTFAKNIDITNPLAILKAQISAYDPDIIFVNTNAFSAADLKDCMHRRVPTLVWDGFIKPLISANKDYDMVLTCLDSIAQKYRKAGAKSEVLNFAFDQRVLPYLNLQKTERLNFVGNLTPVHEERQSLLKALIDNKLDLNLYIGNYKQGRNLLSRTMLREVLQNKKIHTLPNVYAMQTRNIGGVYGLPMYQTMAQAYSTLNFHGDEVDKACNMRLFEATGVGCCMITDRKPGLDQFFEEDKEVVVFGSTAELIDKVRYLQNNAAEAQKIGQAGQKRVFNEHLWSHRMVRFLEIIKTLV